MAGIRQLPNVAVGAAFAGGGLAIAVPAGIAYALLADDFADMRRSTALALVLVPALLCALMGGTLVAALLMRLRRFPWRVLASPGRVATAIGAASAAAGIALGAALGEGFVAFALFVAVAFLVPFVHRRIP